MIFLEERTTRRRHRVVLRSGERVRLGRGAACDIVLNDATVSRVHAELSFETGSAWVRDLVTGGGTAVDGWSVAGAPFPLLTGSTLVTAKVAMKVVIWSVFSGGGRRAVRVSRKSDTE